MALPVAIEKLSTALTLLAFGDEPAATRLQAAWRGPVAGLWEGVYLPANLNDQFKLLWALCAAPSDDPRSTVLRELTPGEVESATQAIIGLALAVAAADAVDAAPADRPKG